MSQMSMTMPVAAPLAAFDAGVLVHDLNNLLSVILTANEALADRFDAHSSGRALAEVSQDAAVRAAQLLRRLPCDAPEDGGVHVAEVAEVAEAAVALAEAARMARPLVPAGVSLEIVASDPDLVCAAEPAALTSALLNLCLNAGQATPVGGTIRLGARACADHVAFWVTDTGRGMTREVLAHCTDRRFTTRADGKGLGLAGVAEFARRCGGRLDLRSSPGRGASVTVVLPRVRPPTGSS